MRLDEKILSRLNELLEFGEQVIATKKSPPPNVIGDSRVDSQKAYQWATSTQNILSRVFGQGSEHYKNFSKHVEHHLTYSPVYHAQGVLRAAIDDYKNEQLFDIRKIIEAELFDDFLEQAEYLCSSGYFQPAAVICGCVLEDGLRKLCNNNGIAITAKPKLDKMNSDLAKAGVYSKLIQKRITTFADLRNKAAHGQWDQFEESDVQEMLAAVRRFMEDHFA
jgi:hypothetical protein